MTLCSPCPLPGRLLLWRSAEVKLCAGGFSSQQYAPQEPTIPEAQPSDDNASQPESEDSDDEGIEGYKKGELTRAAL